MLKEKMIVKRTIALLLLLAMLVVPLTACQTKNSPSDTPASTPSAAETPAEGSEGTEPEEIVHLKMAVPFFGTSAPADAALISEKISEISRKEIGVEVELAFYSISDYYTQIPLILSGDEQLDCLASFGDTTDSWIRKGYLQPITAQVEQYGSGIKEVLGDWLNAGQYYGDQYVLGVRTDLVEAICFCMRKDIVDKYGIDLSQVKQLSDLADVFAVVKENEPDLIPMVASDAQSFGSYQFSIDSLFDNLGVLMPVDEPGSTEIKNFFATEKYKNYCEMLHDWYQKGYVEQDILTETENGSVLVKNGKAFGFLYPYKPYVETQESLVCGYEMAAVELTPPIVSTTTLVANAWAVGRNCVNVDKAVQFYNLCYTNKDILNLLAWGVEGRHYVLDENGQAALPEGMDADSSGYNIGMGWFFFDNFGQYVAAGNPVDLNDAINEFNNTATSSTAMGFHWDSEEVKTEVAACTAILQQYRMALEYGVVDPDTVLPEFLSALEQAGINDVVAAKQAQFDAWRAEQSK